MASKIILTAGDGAGPPAANPGAEAAANLVLAELAVHPDATVLILGDNAYNDGTADEFQTFYAQTWGQSTILKRTLGCAGNHDYNTEGAIPYYNTLGDKAGPKGKGFYSRSVAGWHVVALNTEIDHGEDSEQGEWLKKDLKERSEGPILAFFHAPRFGSGGHGDSKRPKAFWKMLFAERAELILNGHAHHYERFAPQRPDQTPDDKGIRQFIVGTGGRELHGRTKKTRNSELAEFETFGILKLTLETNGYHWEFLAVPGATFADSGTHPTNH